MCEENGSGMDERRGDHGEQYLPVIRRNHDDEDIIEIMGSDDDIPLRYLVQ